MPRLLLPLLSILLLILLLFLLLRSGGAGPGDEARQAPLGAASKAGVEGGLGGLLEDSDDEWVPGMMNN